MAEKNEQQSAAAEVLKNIDELQKHTTQDNSNITNKNGENNTNNQPNQQGSTLFMLNNNAPQPTQENYEPNIKEIEAYYKQNIHSKSYGTTAIVLSVVAVLCSIVLIVAISANINADTTSGFLLWVFNFILVPVLGIAGSVLFAIIGAILGIVAISKAHKRLISWVGFGISLVVLAYVVVMAGVYLFT